MTKGRQKFLYQKLEELEQKESELFVKFPRIYKKVIKRIRKMWTRAYMLKRNNQVDLWCVDLVFLKDRINREVLKESI